MDETDQKIENLREMLIAVLKEMEKLEKRIEFLEMKRIGVIKR